MVLQLSLIRDGSQGFIKPSAGETQHKAIELQSDYPRSKQSGSNQDEGEAERVCIDDRGGYVYALRLTNSFADQSESRERRDVSKVVSTVQVKNGSICRFGSSIVMRKVLAQGCRGEERGGAKS